MSTTIEPSGAPRLGEGFEQLGLRSELLSALNDLGYEEPTPIQSEAIPKLLAGVDLLGQAATGTGKTAAFALPILQLLADDRRTTNPIALVLVPTRELAVQVSEALHRYGQELGARVLAVYGGAPIGRQMSALERGVDVVVATPGRAQDLIDRRKLCLDDIAMVVLDEADEMLDMGFAEEIDAILKSTPEKRQTVLFSATMPARLDSIARRHLRDPVRIRIASETSADGETPRVTQVAYVVARAHKATAVSRIIDVQTPKATIIFCKTREQVDTLTESLSRRGYRAEAIHGGMDQQQRDRVMGRVRSESADLLVATDVAARGLDIDHLTHVINFDVPASPETYVHRIGRVGRAGREGVAITLAEAREHRQLKSIERVTKRKLPIESLPTVADLRARRLESTKEALRAAIVEADFAGLRDVVSALQEEFTLEDIALAALKLAHEPNGAAKDEEIPEPSMPTSGPKSGRGERFGERRPAGRSGRPANDGGKRRPRGGSGPMTRIYVGAGHSARVRPQDLVGAIANESSVQGRDIGSIEITDRFSLVEVPDHSVEEVISALRRTTIKGRKTTVRRERF